MILNTVGYTDNPSMPIYLSFHLLWVNPFYVSKQAEVFLHCEHVKVNIELRANTSFLPYFLQVLLFREIFIIYGN